MSPTREQLPDPQTPTERLLYLGVIMGVAAIIAVGGFAGWLLFAAFGITFPVQAEFVVIGALSFLFGGGIAAKL